MAILRQRAALAAVACLMLTASGVWAQPQERAIRNPAEARIERRAPRPSAAFAAGPDAAIGREARLTLKVDFTEATIRNPGTKQLDKVWLRSYRSGQTEPDAPFVAPTIRVFPGETVRITLDNALPAEPNCESANPNTPHCFNTTNLHAHGLWVSPSGNSDNVLLAIRPQVQFEYEYNIPADHPAGTFWYHPHRHGSTALQVGSGMAGALIIEGQRLPSSSAPGDIDTLLKRADDTPFPERLLVFQQIPYACRDAAGAIKKTPQAWQCAPEDRGQVDKYEDIFTPVAAWRQSGRYTTINGRTVEPLAAKATAGQIERWRLVHAGVRATIKLQFRKRVPSSTAFDGLTAGAQAAWIDANCDAAQTLTHWEIAADGVTREQMLARTSTFLQPGYRSDLLVVFPEAGDYCVVDDEAPAGAVVNGESAGRKLLTVVTVEGGTPVPVSDIATHLKQELKAAARRAMPADVRQQVEDDLENGLRLAKFTPHEDLRSATPSGTQPLMFAMNPPRVGTDVNDLHQYDPARIDRKLTLGATEDWTLKSYSGGHPFHIHVNPFQVLSVVRDAGGVDLTADPQSEYAGLKGVWKDTLFVSAGVTITARTRYRRYIGDFVLHCHILDHEDAGMMQNVSIRLPDGQGGHSHQDEQP